MRYACKMVAALIIVGVNATTAWGGGIVDIEACVRALDRVGYGGAYSVEHEPEDHDPSDECRAMREQLEAWLG